MLHCDGRAATDLAFGMAKRIRYQVIPANILFGDKTFCRVSTGKEGFYRMVDETIKFQSLSAHPATVC